MKKFIASENIEMATSRNFKSSIEFACANTEQCRQYANYSYEKSFVGTIVVFDHATKKVYCYDLRDYVNIENKDDVKKSLAYHIDKISYFEGNENVEFVTFVEASKYEYHGYVGYDSPQTRELNKLKHDNIFQSIYIDILTDVESELYVDESEKIESLNLSLRTYNCLKRANINNIEQIKKLSFDEVIGIRNLGQSSLNELQSVLNIKFV